MGPKVITIDERTYARLAELAGESGLSVGAYVARLVGTEPVAVDWPDIAARTEEYLRETFGFVATPEELAEFEAKHSAIEAGRDARSTRRTSA